MHRFSRSFLRGIICGYNLRDLELLVCAIPKLSKPKPGKPERLKGLTSRPVESKGVRIHLGRPGLRKTVCGRAVTRVRNGNTRVDCRGCLRITNSL